MYFLECFAPNRHNKRKSWKPFIGFSYFMLCVLISRPGSSAIQGLAIAEYLSQLSSTCEKELELKLLAACIVSKLSRKRS